MLQFKSFIAVLERVETRNSFDMNKLPDQFKVGATNEFQLYYPRE